MNVADLIESPTARRWQPTAEGRLRVALVGVGWWTREYALPALVDAANAAPTLLVSGSPRRDDVADLVASTPTVERALDYGAFADGVASDAYDAVYVATPNGTHLAHVRTAARHGAHAICEKPIEATVERAAAAVDAARDAGVRLAVAYRMQADPTVRRLRACVRDGLVGEPVAVHAHMSQPLLELFGPDTWRLDPELAGGGAAVMDLGVYPINTVRFLLGTDPVAVTARGRSEHPAFAAVPDERATFELTMADGTPVACSVSQNAQLSGWLNVVGTDGAVELSPAFFGNDEQSLTLRVGDDVHRVSYTPPDQMREEFELLADRLLADEPVEADGEHALVDARTVSAVYDAIDSGDRESIDDEPDPGAG